jgi:hypothetical protein
MEYAGGTGSYPANAIPPCFAGNVANRDNAFTTTKLEIRYPDSAGDAANNRDIGYHDDSFCYRDGSPLAGVTLPQCAAGRGSLVLVGTQGAPTCPPTA